MVSTDVLNLGPDNKEEKIGFLRRFLLRPGLQAVKRLLQKHPIWETKSSAGTR